MVAHRLLSTAMSAAAVGRVPGLFYLPQFVTSGQHDALVAGCLALRQRVIAMGDSGSSRRPADIPQPKHVKSAQHNLPTQEHFVPLQVTDPDSDAAILRCEHFSKYGEEGHELTYFRGNDNIPRLIREGVVEPATERLQPVSELAAVSELNWKLTLNTYRGVGHGGGRISGFPFHVDIPSNGEVTMILSLLRGATMELVHEDDTENSNVITVELNPCGLLVLSGEARYHWRHRVLPSICASEEGDDEAGVVRRISVVLGCK